MKLFLLNPIKGIINEEFLSNFKGFEIVKDEIPKSILEVADITSDDEKIIAIDPDFCNWSFSKEELEKISNIKCIVLTSTSFSWIDTKAAKELGIPVINTRNFSTNAVAEWAVMMALNVSRKVPLLIKEGFKLDYEKYIGVELKHKKAGIIGLGNIGTRIAEIVSGMGMEVVYWSRNTKDERFINSSLEELMSTSDIIFPAVAQNEETKGLITDTMIKAMKPSSIFISVVHHVYNHELLLEQVAKGNIYGYGFEDKAESFMNYKGNVWAAPEFAWCTKESFERNSAFWLENIINATKGNFKNKVN